MSLSFTTLRVVKVKRDVLHIVLQVNRSKTITIKAFLTVIHPYAVRGLMHSSKK